MPTLATRLFREFSPVIAAPAATVAAESVMGVRYQDLTVWGPFVRSPAERGFGYANTTPHLDEAASRSRS